MRITWDALAEAHHAVAESEAEEQVLRAWLESCNAGGCDATVAALGRHGDGVAEALIGTELVPDAPTYPNLEGIWREGGHRLYLVIRDPGGEFIARPLAKPDAAWTTVRQHGRDWHFVCPLSACVPAAVLGLLDAPPGSPHTAVDSSVVALIEELAERSRVGVAKYGTTTDRTDLTPAEWCRHALEEGLDRLVYLRRLLTDLERTRDVVTRLKAGHDEWLDEDGEMFPPQDFITALADLYELWGIPDGQTTAEGGRGTTDEEEPS